MLEFGAPELVILSIPIITLAFSALMFVHLLGNKQLNDTERIFWAIAMVFFPPFAEIIYYLSVYTDKWGIRKVAKNNIESEN